MYLPSKIMWKLHHAKSSPRNIVSEQGRLTIKHIHPLPQTAFHISTYTHTSTTKFSLTDTHKDKHIYTLARMHACTQAHTNTHAANTHTHIYTHRYTHSHAHTHTRAHTRTHTLTYTNTHTRTHTHHGRAHDTKKKVKVSRHND